MKNKRLLCFNVHYSPESFGGATIVAEELNTLLVNDHNWEILVLTTRSDENFLPYHILKYATKNVTVVSVNIPKDKLSEEELYNNPKLEPILTDLFEWFQPDIVHGHAVQNIGFNFGAIAKKHDIPVVLTLHDCLWICSKQFMVNNHGRYCNQKVIDPNICLYCVENLSSLLERKRFFYDASTQIDKFLFPSTFHMNLHVENGLPFEKCFVNKNGVTFPKTSFEKNSLKRVRFGFIGGPGFIKGGEIIKEAFKNLEGNYILKLVDAGLKLNHSWESDFHAWGLESHQFEIIEPYDQSTIDDFFGEIDVLLFPSQWKESFGLTVREALVRDVWVIATNGGGTIEDISSDPIYLKNAICQCLTKDWSNFHNSFKSDVTNYIMQAKELSNFYHELVSNHEST
jgi:glycosyltransferase involved in cell wall biosynthesis